MTASEASPNHVPHKVTIRNRVGSLIQRSALIQAWIVIIVIFGLLKPADFLTATNFASIFGTQTFVAFLVLALIVVLRVGEFDLSVAATMTVTSCLFAVLNAQHGFGLVPAVLLTLLFGACIGLSNGVLVVGLGAQSLIVTLGMATVLSGVALWLTNEQTIVGISQNLVNAVTTDKFLGIELGFYYALALMLVLAYLFRYTVLGRRMLFVGKNADVARLSGVNVGRLKVGAFCLTGILAGAAGLVFAGTSGSADATSGLAYLLPVYAAAFLGSTATRGGEFTPVGSMVAVYLLVTGTQGLAIAGVAQYAEQIFYGLALIIAIGGAKWLMREKRRKVVTVDTAEAIARSGTPDEKAIAKAEPV